MSSGGQQFAPVELPAGADLREDSSLTPLITTSDKYPIPITGSASYKDDPPTGRETHSYAPAHGNPQHTSEKISLIGGTDGGGGIEVAYTYLVAHQGQQQQPIDPERGGIDATSSFKTNYYSNTGSNTPAGSSELQKRMLRSFGSMFHSPNYFSSRIRPQLGQPTH